MPDLLNIYRERSGQAGFWAEPVNALSNISFLLAAFAGYRFAIRRQALTAQTWILILMSVLIAIGSFSFHTAANEFTKWLDMLPIAAFQIVFLWLCARRILNWPLWLSAGLIALVMTTSFAAMPVRLLNGSVSYLPVLLATTVIAGAVLCQRGAEATTLLAAVATFVASITARSIDWIVPFPVGTHFIWHLLNGVVIFLAIHTWVLHVAGSRVGVLLPSDC